MYYPYLRGRQFELIVKNLQIYQNGFQRISFPIITTPSQTKFRNLYILKFY